MFAKNGRSCPLCEYLTEEMASPCGLEKGWYRESSSKGNALVKCNHHIDEGFEDVLNSAISDHLKILKELKRQKRLVIRAKQQ